MRKKQSQKPELQLSELVKKARAEHGAKAKAIYEKAKKDLADLGYIIGAVGKINFVTGQMSYDVILVPVKGDPQ